jgi:hypothetical protein
LYLIIKPALSDENIEVLLNKFPSIIVNYSTLIPSKHKNKITWCRSDIQHLSINQLTCIENRLLLNKKEIQFLTFDKSNETLEKIDTQDFESNIINKWEIETEENGLYLISISSNIGAFGFLNNEPVTLISNDILSKKNSGKLWIPLLKGKNILYLVEKAKRGNFDTVKVLGELDFNQIKNEIFKKVSSNSKDDYTWETTDFLPYLETINGTDAYIVLEMERINKLYPFANNVETNILVGQFVQQNKNYFIEKYIFEKYPDLYFSNLNITNSKNFCTFLQQLIFDGQKKMAEEYFKKCISYFSKNNSIPNKEKEISDLYSMRLISLFQIGRISDASEVLEITKEKCHPFPLNTETLKKYTNMLKEENVTLTQSFDETIGFQIKENIENYDSQPEQLTYLYKMFLSLTNNLIKAKDGAVSLDYFFKLNKNSNLKLKNDFENYCIEKIQSKVEKAKENKSIKQLEEIIEKYESIISLPEIRMILMEEYFKQGAFLKALSLAHLIYEKYPEFQPKIIAMMVILETMSEYPVHLRKTIPNVLLKQDLKIMGESTNLEKLCMLTSSKPIEKRKIGKLIKTISLEPNHLEYTNHSQIPEYQANESIFTNNNLIITGSSYLINFSFIKNEIEWTYHSENEYKKENENGPHQKRFITRHAGNQLFMYTNQDFSKNKTIKSFDLRGNLIWDLLDQKTSYRNEPLCTPIESQGKIFGLSYSNRESIIVVSFTVYDSSSGSLISTTPISYIRDKNWNTFTHDDHFTQDNSFVYGYSGTGIIFKADSNSGMILWEKGFPKPSIDQQPWNTKGYAPSGFIKLFGNTLICFMPDDQLFTGLNKITGEYIWRTGLIKPKFIHARENNEAIFYSTASIGNEPTVFKVNPKNGEIIWQSKTNGLVISGEGDLLGSSLYLPSEKSILEFDSISGKLLNVIDLNIQLLKINCSIEHTVIFSAHSAFLFKNDGDFNLAQIKDLESSIVVSKIYEPDAPTITKPLFESINLETMIKIPEPFYTSSDPWKKTELIKTSKPFHYLLKCNENLSLFREGYYLKNGIYVPPEIIWFGQYPCYSICDDVLYVSEYGRIFASDLFTRETIWIYRYDRNSPFISNQWNKTLPLIAANKQFIAFQTENKTIRVLENATQKIIVEFNSLPVSNLEISSNFIVTFSNRQPIKCYDILQEAKLIWEIPTVQNRQDIFLENGYLVLLIPGGGTIKFIDIKTGNTKVQVKSTFGDLYFTNRWKIDENFIYAYKRLYDIKTGKPLANYGSAEPVEGGGYVAFFKFCGQEGNYFDKNGQKYAFKTKGIQQDDNYHFAAIRKGNFITFFSFWFIETFELRDDHLISINFTSINTGRFGKHANQTGMELFTLENSFLEIRENDMYFFGSFDTEFNLEKIKSFRVVNKRKFKWPYSELYPEEDVTEKNWISYFGQKPKQNLSYQIFSDENYAYLKFKLSPNLNKKNKNTLNISADGKAGKIIFIWDVENWENVRCSFNVHEQTESWKETDFKGNINLYIKINLNAFAEFFSDTLPFMNIELRQMTNRQQVGAYRLGGAYNNLLNLWPWLNYTNDEAQTLKDFLLRTALYENKVNFIPQGIDLIAWLKDRRRFKSVENNLQLLNNMLEKNAKYYCSVNILSALLLEEIQYLKINQSQMDEFSEEFRQKVSEIILKLSKQANSINMNKEWSDYALSFWTIEIFPLKYKPISFNINEKITYAKLYSALSISSDNKQVFYSNFYNENNLLTSNINQPYLEWVLPGLIPNYPNELNLNLITFESFEDEKAGLGKMNFYSPKGNKEFCNRNGEITDATCKIINFKSNESIKFKNDSYYYMNHKYDCFVLDISSKKITVGIKLPNIKSPTILSSTGQSIDSIMYTLENLPSDNKNGQMMVTEYLNLKGTADEKELISIYSKWLNSLKSNSSSSYKALNIIFDQNKEKNDIIEFINNIIQESKLTPQAPRKFFIDHLNLILNKDARSVLGPFYKELLIKPEIKLNPNTEYKTIDSSHQFMENLNANKKGGSIYIASKLIVASEEKAYIFTRAENNWATSHNSSTFSIWLNNDLIIENVSYINYEQNTYSQKVNLKKGENILLMKINGIENYVWGTNYSLCVGDVYGAPIKGLKYNSFVK